jgi:hypothetical protein
MPAPKHDWPVPSMDNGPGKDMHACWTQLCRASQTEGSAAIALRQPRIPPETQAEKTDFNSTLRS